MGDDSMYEVWKQVSIDGVLFDYEISNWGISENSPQRKSSNAIKMMVGI